MANIQRVQPFFTWDQPDFTVLREDGKMQKALCSCAPSSTLVTGAWPVGFCVPQWGYAGDPQLDGTIRQSFSLHVPGQRSGTQI